MCVSMHGVETTNHTFGGSRLLRSDDDATRWKSPNLKAEDWKDVKYWIMHAQHLTQRWRIQKSWIFHSLFSLSFYFIFISPCEDTAHRLSSQDNVTLCVPIKWSTKRLKVKERSVLCHVKCILQFCFFFHSGCFIIRTSWLWEILVRYEVLWNSSKSPAPKLVYLLLDPCI